MTNAQHAEQSGGVFSIFNDLKIGTKIGIGFVVILLITAALAAMSYGSLVSLGKGFDSYAQRVGVVSIARDVDRQFVDFRRHVREFAVSGAEAEAKTAREIAVKLNDSIKRGIATIKNPERKAKMVSISDRFALYSKDFDRLVPLRVEQDKLALEVLDPTGMKLRKDVEEIQHLTASKAGNTNAFILSGELMKQVMVLRLRVNKVLARHDHTAAAEIEGMFGAMKATLGAMESSGLSTDVRKVFDELKALVEKYHDTYRRVGELSKTIEELVNGEMKKAAEDIAADALFIKESGIADEHAIETEVGQQIISTERLVMLFTIAGIVLGVALAWLIGRMIARPVVGLVDAMRKLGEGDFSVVLPGLGRKDEVGGMADAVEAFKERAEEKARQEADEKAAIDRKIAQERKAAMVALADSFEGAVGNIVTGVSATSSQLEIAAQTLTKTAEMTETLSTNVAAVSEEASANVQSVASATNEMSASVSEISRQVQESTRIANSAVSQAQSTDERINELSQAASRIGDVVKLITAIAEQTNLLALNATIEAARAGEAGKGFAVVAQEVKALAAQTAKATGEISAQISGMQTATQESVAAIREIGGTIGHMSEISAAIAAAVEEQGAATQEIARNIQQAAQATGEVASNIADVNRGATETGSASTQVLSSAQDLSQQSTKLREQVEQFLRTVRAA